MSPAAQLDSEMLESLQGVLDPEVGISIVDLGLVYTAVQHPEAIEVAVTLTTRACPLGPAIIDTIHDALAKRFPRARLDIRLVWTPVWNSDRITPRGRALLARRLEAAPHVPLYGRGHDRRPLRRAANAQCPDPGQCDAAQSGRGASVCRRSRSEAGAVPAQERLPQFLPVEIPGERPRCLADLHQPHSRLNPRSAAVVCCGAGCSR